MKNIVLLFKKDILRFFKDKPAVILTFLVPAALIIIFGSIFGGGGGSRGKIPIIVVNESDLDLADHIEEQIDSSSSLRSVKTFADENGVTTEIDHGKAKELVKSGKYPAALIMPSDFFSDTSSSLNFKYYYDPRNEIESQLIQGTIQKTIFLNLPELFPVLMQREAKSFLGKAKSDSFNTDLTSLVGEYFGVDEKEFTKSITQFDLETFTENDSDKDEGESFDIFSSLIKFDSQQLVGTEIKNPGVTRIVGGWAIMFLLFTLTGIASSIFEEKQEGSLKRLFCMPISKSQYLWAKYLFSIFMGIIQLFVLFLFAYFLYDVDIFTNFINLLAVIFVSAAAAVAFGMVIIAFSSSLAQANAISTLFILIMSGLGGSWFPVTLFPEWMQLISKFTLTYWSVEGFLQVLWRNAEIGELIFPYIFILISIALVFNLIALYFFKKRQVF